MVGSWRLLMTVVARSLEMEVGLVTRDLGDGQIEMTAPSMTPDNPYGPGAVHDLEPGVYCEEVITRQSELAVPDALASAQWSANNPDLKHGMIAYLGYPIYWPDGEVYGTICVLGSEPRDFSAADRALLLSARDAIHDSWGALESARPPSVRDGKSMAPEALGSFSVDIASVQVRLSPAVAQFYGLENTPQPMATSVWADCFPTETRDRLRDGLHQIGAGALRRASGAELLASTGGIHLVRMAARGILNGAGETVAIVGLQSTIHADVLRQIGASTPRRSIETDDSRNDYVMQVAPDGTITWLTGPMQSLLRLRESPVGLPVAGVFHAMYDGHDIEAAVEAVLVERTSGELVVFQADVGAPPYVAFIEVLPSATQIPSECRIVVLPNDVPSTAEASDPFPVRDPVTGLPTRVELEYRLRFQLERAKRRTNKPTLAFARIDVTNYNAMVHIHGHQAVDVAMAQLGDRLKSADRFVASLGFGFFAVVVYVDGATALRALADQLRTEGSRVPDGVAVRPEVSVGTVDVLSLNLGPTDDILLAVTSSLGSPIDEEKPVLVRLTKREVEIAALVAQGMSNREVADELVIAVRTVEGHLDRIRDKLGITSRTQLVARVLSQPELLIPGRAPGR